MSDKNYNFKGYATVYEVECSDGKTIATGAFKHQSGTKVPLVDTHDHTSIKSVIGHMLLTDDGRGMYGPAKLNNTQAGLHAKAAIENGDPLYLSIYANKVKHVNGRVTSGYIKEVSIVFAGANPEAKIDEVIVHGDDFDFPIIKEDEFIIHSGVEINAEDEAEEEPPTEEPNTETEEPKEEPKEDPKPEEAEEDIEEVTDASESEENVEHADDSQKTGFDIYATLTEDEKSLLSWLIDTIIGGDTKTPTETVEQAAGSTVKEVYDGLSAEKRDLFIYIITSLAEEGQEQENISQGEHMKSYKLFEDQTGNNENTLSHAELNGLLKQAKDMKASSLREVFASNDSDVIAHGVSADTLGLLFPEAKDVRSGAPYMVTDDQGWVNTVLVGVNKSPFSNVRSSYADLTDEEARAHGYVTGDEKFEDFFKVYRRETLPQTIYKTEKIDRDNLADITDFDYVQWIKGIMATKLRYELARAILIGDGRAIDHQFKIQEDKIRPIAFDNSVYSIPVYFGSEMTVLNILDDFVMKRKLYKGAGSPTFFTTSEWTSEMLVVRDTLGHRMHDMASLKAELRVRDIVEVTPMSNVTTNVEGVDYELLGVVTNLTDYNLGATKMGQTSFFEDFDIDFNRYTYLGETRSSGAMVTPKAALVLWRELAAG